jgi:hypothetical protein
VGYLDGINSDVVALDGVAQEIYAGLGSLNAVLNSSSALNGADPAATDQLTKNLNTVAVSEAGVGGGVRPCAGHGGCELGVWVWVCAVGR